MALFDGGPAARFSLAEANDAPYRMSPTARANRSRR